MDRLSYRVSMSATAARIVETPAGTMPRRVFLHTVGAGNVYLGDQSVTALTGFELPGNTIFGPITVVRELWGVRSGGSSEVHVLHEGRPG